MSVAPSGWTMNPPEYWVRGNFSAGLLGLMMVPLPVTAHSSLPLTRPPRALVPPLHSRLKVVITWPSDTVMLNLSWALGSLRDGMFASPPKVTVAGASAPQVAGPQKEQQTLQPRRQGYSKHSSGRFLFCGCSVVSGSEAPPAGRSPGVAPGTPSVHQPGARVQRGSGSPPVAGPSLSIDRPPSLSRRQSLGPGNPPLAPLGAFGPGR